MKFVLCLRLVFVAGKYAHILGNFLLGVVNFWRKVNFQLVDYLRGEVSMGREFSRG